MVGVRDRGPRRLGGAGLRRLRRRRGGGRRQRRRALRKPGRTVIAIDSDLGSAAEDARQAYIGTNNVKAGEEAGRAAAALRPKGGKVVTFVGTSAAANARERKQGFFRGAGPAFT